MVMPRKNSERIQRENMWSGSVRITGVRISLWALVAVLVLPSAGVHAEADCQGDGARRGVEESLPLYHADFSLDYWSNETSDPVVTECGEYYATQFLKNWFKAQDYLMTPCREQLRVAGFQVALHNGAVVKIHDTRVWVETGFNVSLGPGYTESRDDAQRHILDCYGIIKRLLSNVSQMEQHVPNMRVTEVPAGTEKNETCAPAHMKPLTFAFSQTSWLCRTGHFNDTRWRCLHNGDYNPSSLSTMTSSPPTVTSQVGSSLEVTDSHKTSSGDLTSVTGSSSTLGGLTTTSPELTVDVSLLTTPAPTTTPPFGSAWGIQLVDPQTPLRLVEGERQVALLTQVWADRNTVCAGVNNCSISVEISFFSGTNPEPVCRRTGGRMPQIVVGLAAGAPPGEDSCTHTVRHHTAGRHQHVMQLKAVSDNKYDGQQQRQVALALLRTVSDGARREVVRQTFYKLPVEVVDKDRKATCQSINDPHITTFDGLEYNNYFEGEFVMYRHRTLPFKVHVIYQTCGPTTPASCNCAVAVQSGDDVMVIDRCRRTGLRPAYMRWWGQDFTPMAVQLFTNGQLTPGTRIYQEDEGRKYYIYLPHGTHVKVMVSGELLNVWVVATPGDISQTEGLCGTYDWDRNNDLQPSNGTPPYNRQPPSKVRAQPTHFVLSWRVDYGGPLSLFGGVARSARPYAPPQYCECEQDAPEPRCGYAHDVNYCDLIQGEDVTESLVARAVPSSVTSSVTSSRRARRDVGYNVLSVIPQDPVIINKKFVPPKYSWHENSVWNKVTAKDYCRKHIKEDYPVGRLCADLVAAVNFNQEITTCVEDIQITGNTSWADSAREAMKEQCLEEVQRNGTLPSDITDRINNLICLHDCSGHGQCVQGVCRCRLGYTGPDCSVSERAPPYAGQMPHYGLCDIRFMNCSHVIVYGKHFINSVKLTCHFRECEVTDTSYTPGSVVITRPAIFLNFGAVECAVPAVRSYLVSVSNNGVNTSEPLVFIPFDSVCRSCDAVNSTCVKRRNSCIIDGKCYREGEVDSHNQCLVCRPDANELQWTTLPELKCERAWWYNIKLPNWAVAVPAAIGGSLVGVLFGFLLYKCCCKNRKQGQAENKDMGSRDDYDTSPIEDAMLHRNRGLPVFSGDRFSEVSLPRQSGIIDNYFYNDGRGVENGVDSTTYF